jgi:hypothetical protein
MGVATLGNHRFRLDPESVSWDFKIHAVDLPAVGGKVVQVLGTELGDMTVTGSFGVGGWREQAEFLKTMKTIGDDQVNAQRASNSTVQPFRFKYPPKGWDFAVYLTGFTAPGSSRSIQLSETIANPKWTLTLFIVEGAGTLKKVAQDVYISRLSQGMGWKQTAYNGPMTMGEVEGALNGRTLVEYISEELGIAPAQTRADGAVRGDGGWNMP